jgi:hypothetical protein
MVTVLAPTIVMLARAASRFRKLETNYNSD